MKLEKQKAAEYRQKQKELGLAADGQAFGNPEKITALRQNLS